MELVVKDAAVIYDKKTVGMTGVSFSALGGTITGIAGDEGMGKTTLLYSVARLVDLTEGSITVNGNDISSLSVRDVNAVLISPSLKWPGRKKVIDCLADVQIIRGKKRTEALGEAIAAAKTIGIEELLNVKVGKLDEGGRFYMSLASALIRKAGIILVDQLNINEEMIEKLKTVALRNDAVALLVVPDGFFSKDIGSCVVIGPKEERPNP